MNIADGKFVFGAFSSSPFDFFFKFNSFLADDDDDGDPSRRDSVTKTLMRGKRRNKDWAFSNETSYHPSVRERESLGLENTHTLHPSLMNNDKRRSARARARATSRWWRPDASSISFFFATRLTMCFFFGIIFTQDFFKSQQKRKEKKRRGKPSDEKLIVDLRNRRALFFSFFMG